MPSGALIFRFFAFQQCIDRYPKKVRKGHNIHKARLGAAFLIGPQGCTLQSNPISELLLGQAL